MELHDVLWLRNEVFVFGQRITAEPEVDGRDPECVHVLGWESERLVATARLFMDHEPVKVGRIAVHNDLQRRGLGSELMAYVHGLIAGRHAEMSAQAHLERWYSSLGWERIGEVYEEAEIPHVRMVRRP
jgi:ElaA protein